MKRRFVLIIFSALGLAIGAVSFVHFYFFRSERQRLIDQQVEAVATSLYASDLSQFAFDDLEEAGDIVADALGDERLGAVIVVYDSDGRIRYENRNSELLGGEFPRSPPLLTISRNNHSARIMNVELPGGSGVLQAGVLLDRGQVRWNSLGRSIFVYLALIGLVLVGVTWILTSVLLRPLRSLASYLRFLAESGGSDPSRGEASPSLPQNLRASDEFGELVSAARELAERLRGDVALGQASAAQMAHELKTPITIIRNSLEGLEGRAASEARSEVDRLTKVVNEFLDWARVGRISPAEDRHAIRPAKVVPALCDRLGRGEVGRLVCEVRQEDAVVFAKPEWFEQCVTNLVSNALRYSPSARPVRVVIEETCLRVIDEGPGLPAEVERRLGQPFNTWTPPERAEADDFRSTGLGLAWVLRVSKGYGWGFEMRRRPEGGTEAILRY